MKIFCRRGSRQVVKQYYHSRESGATNFAEDHLISFLLFLVRLGLGFSHHHLIAILIITSSPFSYFLVRLGLPYLYLSRFFESPDSWRRSRSPPPGYRSTRCWPTSWQLESAICGPRSWRECPFCNSMESQTSRTMVGNFELQ